ncbi:MAG TPA: Gfo/Idh/MocA family oxidoreductase, partial [Inquilinus sp.]|nr:Gfo/Idh/MocA family oxidoreductase [Inquilinus sp.]
MVSGTAERAPSRRLRLGMIGGGRDAFIGAVHRLAARMDDRWDFVAGALSSDPEKALASAADLRLDPARAYPSWQAMLDGERKLRDSGGPAIDAVAIVTPNHVHHGPAKAFLEAGFHVICDKPMTTTVADAEDLVAAVT